MNIEVLENEKENVKIELIGENAGFVQLVAKAGWEVGGQIAPVQEHPFIEEPKLVSIGSGAKKNLEKAVSKVAKDLDELDSQISRALKK